MSGSVDVTDRPVQRLSPGEVRPVRRLTADEERRCEQSVPAAFAAQVGRTPRARALDDESGALTYEELDRAANRVAAGLAAERGTAHEPVGILLREGADFVVALLGAMKVGKLALPLDPRAPAPALARVLEDAGARLLITGEEAPAAGLDVEVRALHRYGTGGGAPVDLPVAPGDGALLLYTSGSTGEPKALCRPHRAVLHHALTTADLFDIGQETRVGLLLSPAFGTAYGLMFATLLTGGTILRYLPDERGLAGVPKWLSRQRVAITSMVPSMLNTLLSAASDGGLPSLSHLSIGSERLTRASAQAVRALLHPEAKLVQTFGTTETARICVNVIEGPIEPGEGPLPVGLAVPGYRVAVLAADGSPAETGSAGEIVVSGRYASYYWRRGAERHGAPAPAEEARGWSVHTGDLGTVDGEGRLVFVGRRDRRVKVRGHRVELEAVERALLELDAVRQAVVVDEASALGGRVLIAYLVLLGPSGPDGVGGLRSRLRATLPPFMVPSRMVVLDDLPLLPSGKVDLRGLAAAPPEADGDPGAPVLTETEALLAEIWADALERERIGRDEDFFELGGDSLAAAVIAAEVHATFGLEIELRAVVENPTLAKLAKLVDELRSGQDEVDEPPLVRASREEPLPLSLAQEPTWEQCRSADASAGYVMARASRIRGPLDVAAFRASVDRIVHRHETLRTTFAELDGRPLQVVHPSMPIDVPLVDVSSAPDPPRRAAEVLDEASRTTFDLERGPLVRFWLVRTAQDEHHLVRVHHHIVSDAWSWRVFFDELRVLYDAHRRGAPPPLPDELALQYGDFAVWERRRLRPASPRYEDQLAAWRRTFLVPPPALDPPFARRGAGTEAAPSDGLVWFGLAPETSRRLDALGRELGATYYMVRMAAFAARLASDTGREDGVVGTYVTNRRRPELQEMFGFFSNLSMVRLAFDPAITMREWIVRVRAAVIDAGSRAEIPYGQVVAELARAGIQLPDPRAVFGATEQHPRLRFGGLEITPLRPAFPVMPWGFSFMVDRYFESDSCLASFDATLYEPADVRAFVAGFQRLADEAAAHPDAPLGQLAST